MSLDVMLKGKTTEVSCTCTTCWNEHTRQESEQLFDWNITHNLWAMAKEAGIRQHLWAPEEIGIARAEQLIEPLRSGLALLQADPDRFRKFNPSNGWGDYEGLVNFVREYLQACEKYPSATISVSR